MSLHVCRSRGVAAKRHHFGSITVYSSSFLSQIVHLNCFKMSVQSKSSALNASMCLYAISLMAPPCANRKCHILQQKIQIQTPDLNYSLYSCENHIDKSQQWHTCHVMLQAAHGSFWSLAMEHWVMITPCFVWFALNFTYVMTLRPRTYLLMFCYVPLLLPVVAAENTQTATTKIWHVLKHSPDLDGLLKT